VISQAIAGVSTLLLIGVGWVIGLRLLLLARRTRGIPELTLGAGTLLIGGLGYPFAIATNVVGATRPALAGVFMVTGATLCHLGIVANTFFTWKVFRPRALWARGLVGLFIAAAAVGFTANLRVVLATASPAMSAVQPWTFFLCLVAASAFGWSGVEALAYHTKLRRRLALGLADPVVTNRFLLWGVTSLASSAGSLVNAFFTLASPLSVLDPVALAVCGSCSALSAVVMTLTFLPPATYLRFIEARHAARAATR